MGKVFLIAFILDGVYQLVELRWFYPGEAVAGLFIWPSFRTFCCAVR